MQTFVAQDNIFPLRDPEQRALFINSGYPTTVNTQRDAATQSFKIKPGLFCPEAFYDYYVDRDFIEASEYVRAFGFVRAAVSWTVEGTLLPAHNTWATIMVAVPFDTKKPDGTTSSTTQTVALKYFIADSWNRSALFIKNTVTTGNSTLVIAATAREAAFPAEAASNASDSLGIDIITFVPGAQLIKDRKRCDVVFYAVDNSIYGLSSVLGKLKNLPDPPHEQTILRVLQAAHQVEAALSAATHSTGLTRTELLRELRIPGLLMSTGARVSDSTLSRIKSPGQRSGGKTSE
jgi:hypothetical protein